MHAKFCWFTVFKTELVVVTSHHIQWNLECDHLDNQTTLRKRPLFSHPILVLPCLNHLDKVTILLIRPKAVQLSRFHCISVQIHGQTVYIIYIRRAFKIKQNLSLLLYFSLKGTSRGLSGVFLPLVMNPLGRLKY